MFIRHHSHLLCQAIVHLYTNITWRCINYAHWPSGLELSFLRDTGHQARGYLPWRCWPLCLEPAFLRDCWDQVNRTFYWSTVSCSKVQSLYLTDGEMLPTFPPNSFIQPQHIWRPISADTLLVSLEALLLATCRFYFVVIELKTNGLILKWLHLTSCFN